MTLISHKKISQDVRVLIYEYPFAERVNGKLHQTILDCSTPGDRNPNIGQVHMTDWTSFEQFKLIGNWVKTLLIPLVESYIRLMLKLLFLQLIAN